MNYLICFVNENGEDWCIVSGDGYDYMYNLFEKMSPPPGWNMELRETEEDVDTYMDYTVIRYDHSNF